MSGQEKAEFVNRDSCIGCGSLHLRELSSGLFNEQPLLGYLRNDPWGEDPVPSLHGLRWVYVRCKDCGQAFHQRILSPEWSAIKFEKWMTAKAIAAHLQPINTSQARFERASHFAQHILQLEYLTRPLRGRHPLKVVDFGCGDGEFVEMCTLFGFQAAGIDVSAERRANNRATVLDNIAQVEGPVHVVTLFEVLEHLERPRAVLESLAEILVPQGILVLETPDTSGVESIKNEADYRAIHPLDHINGFTPTTLREFAERLGFEAIRKPVCQFTCEPARVYRQELKRWLKFAVPRRTQLYFARRH